MSIFNDKDIDFLQKWGNDVAQKHWMADYNSKIYPLPDKKDIQKMKDFFRTKYTEKRFLAKEESEESEDDSEEERKKKAKKKKAVAKKKKSKN